MNMLIKTLSVLSASAFIFQAHAQYRIEVLDSSRLLLGEGVVVNKTSFRGLSVVNDRTIWVSGSRGTIALSVDGGNTFVYRQLKGYERSDFRDIEAFDAQRAIVMSSGTPACILKTNDGGVTWKEVYNNPDSAYFLDAMDFWDEKRGMLVGDPINGHFVVMQTNDGGDTWRELDTTYTPKAMEGEAVFAASGTSLRCWGKDAVGFVSGGSVTRFLHSTAFDLSRQRGTKWQEQKTYIQAGTAPQGTFSFSLIDEQYEGFIMVGGDYVKDSVQAKNSSLVFLIGHHDFREYSDTKKYKSCVETISNAGKDKNRVAVATGTRGVELFRYLEWKTISPEPFHVVRKAKKGKAVFLAGPNGKIGRLIY